MAHRVIAVIAVDPAYTSKWGAPYGAFGRALDLAAGLTHSESPGTVLPAPRRTRGPRRRLARRVRLASDVVLLADTQLTTPGRPTRPAVSTAPEPPTQWHRVLTLLADGSLFIGTRDVWTQAAVHRPAVATVISVCYASILVCGVLALVVRGRRALARVDLCVLVTGLTLALCAFVLLHRGTDESVLTAQAARELVAGHAGAAHP